MSRVIKFRGWNKQSHIMVDDIRTMNGRNGTVALSEFFDPDMIVLPLQYTGLNDKNGAEIYEGDIVTISNIFLGKNVPMEVKWSTPEAHWYLTNGKVGHVFSPAHFNEVIGNIYENPELIAIS